MTYPEFLEEWRNDEDYCLVRTSGSTGEPKIIRLPKSLMRHSAERTLEFFGLYEDDHIHSCISPDFIGGKMMAVRAEVGGLKLTWEEPSNRPELLHRFTDNAPLLVALVPSQMLAILDQGIPPAFADTVWLIGGSPIDATLRRRIVDADIEAWESYGMTETASHIALRMILPELQPFRAFDDVGLSLDDRGCLVIAQGDSVVVTNDLAELHVEEMFSITRFSITGRADNVIISGAKKIQPEKVEAAIAPLLSPHGIAEVMLTSEPDVKWGARTILLLCQTAGKLPEAERGFTDADHDALIALAMDVCRKNLQPHEVPKEIRIVDSLPRTPNGKLRRK